MTHQLLTTALTSRWRFPRDSGNDSLYSLSRSGFTARSVTLNDITAIFQSKSFIRQLQPEAIKIQMRLRSSASWNSSKRKSMWVIKPAPFLMRKFISVQKKRRSLLTNKCSFMLALRKMTSKSILGHSKRRWLTVQTWPASTEKRNLEV